MTSQISDRTAPGPENRASGALPKAILSGLPTHDLPHIFCDSFRRSPDFGLPHPHDSPAAGLQLMVVSAVTGHIGLDLWDPVVCVASSGQPQFPVCPFLPMPEITIAEDCDLGTTKDQIWSSWQTFGMKTVPESLTPKLSPEEQLRARVLLVVPPHGFGGLWRRRRSVSKLRGPPKMDRHDGLKQKLN